MAGMMANFLGPAVAAEPASRRQAKPAVTGRDGLGEHWENPDYYGCLRRYESGSPLGGGPYAVLSISATDETARHDWRDFQQLKNHLLGDEWEGLELYPAESRLVDPSNRFYLWCFPKGVIPWGLPSGRSVRDAGELPVPQRAFPN